MIAFDYFVVWCTLEDGKRNKTEEFVPLEKWMAGAYNFDTQKSIKE